jgi:cellulose biosynthesis protein BcsQ/HAMP domain-containing protein
MPHDSWDLLRHVVVFLIGCVVTTGIVAAVGAWLSWFRSPRRARELDAVATELKKQLLAAQRTIEQTKVRHKTLLASLEEFRKSDEEMRRQRTADEQIFEHCQTELQNQQVRLAEVEEAVEALKREKTRIFAAGRKAFLNWRETERQLQALVSQDGLSWESSPVQPPPAFRPLAVRPAPIVAVMNLKGGVGKTTITANLAYALAKRTLRVLVVDLDHQASLSGLCLTPEQIEASRGDNGKLVNRVLQAAGDYGGTVLDNLAAIESLPGAFCLAASPQLLPLEERLKARWLLNPAGPDGRFVLRDAFHAPLVQERFDWILIDCPPRPTTACVNALAAADRVLIPTILDRVSADGLPLMLGWLKTLKANGVCPDLDVLGVIGNCTHSKARLTNREKDVLGRLQTLCDDVWDWPIKPFTTFLPDKPAFAEAAERRAFAANHKEIGPLFAALADEFLARQVNHERRQPANASA